MSENGSLEHETGSQCHSERAQSLCSEDFADLLDIPTSRPRADDAPSPTQPATCPHPGYLSGMCIRCGANKPETEEDEKTLLAFHYVHHQLEFSKDEAQRLSDMRTAEAEGRGKLQLVLDLDHTLLHSVPLDYAVALPSLKEWFAAEMEAEMEDPIKHKRTLHEIPACFSMTKLRPGVFTLLHALKSLYEMHIYTMGEELYAAEMAKLLDPNKELFHRKVISREHSSMPMAKSLDVVIGSDRSTVIVDDTWQVWSQHSENLLCPSKYFFFPAVMSRDSSAPPRGWLEMRADECSSTSELHNIQTALERIHRAYFASPPQRRDVRSVMKSLLKRKRQRPSDG